MNHSIFYNKRNAFRFPYLSRAACTNGKKSGIGTVENLGPDGMFLSMAELFNVGEKIDINFKFRHGCHKINLQGEVVRVASEGIGIKFLWS